MSEHASQSRTYSLFDPLLVLVLVAAVIQLVRILTVAAAPHGETPFLSANDRSRWCTIASLTEDGSFVIDRFLDRRDTSNKFRTWYSIDMVRKTETDGSEHYYSSKPPLLSVMYAAVCSPIATLWNRRLSDAPLEVGRTLLLVTQWLPMTLFWIGCWMWILRSVHDSWQQMILLSFVLFGTFLTTFTNTINNHLPAAISMAASLVLLRMVAGSGTEQTTSWRSIRDCILLGIAASFTAACDLPALAWAAILIPLVWLLTRSISRTAWMVFGMLPVALAFAVTNWIAYGDLKPPYAHREELGTRITTIPLSIADSSQTTQEPTATDLAAIGKALLGANERIMAPISIQPARRENTWEASFKTESDLSKRFAVVRDGENWAIHQWNDWYDYPKSYWLPKNKRGVDLGEPSIARYAFHVLIGHHGVLSLTPFWLCSIVGLAAMLRQPSDRYRFLLALAIMSVTTVCLAFYISRPLIDRNYGGVASGFRWMFWLIPAWFVFLPEGLNQVSRSWMGKAFIMASLLISIFWATIPWANPWQSPLLFTWFS